MKVTRDFIEIFDGTKAQVGYLELTVTKDPIAIATRLPQLG
jgi:hypothetical protein